MNETVYLVDLNNANDVLVECINTLADNLEKAATAIKGFNSNTTNSLTGQGYNTIRLKLSLYASIYSQAAKVVRNVSKNIKSANSGVIKAMNGETSVSCGQNLIDEIENQIKDLKVEDYLYLTGNESEHMLTYKMREAYKKYEEDKAYFNELLDKIKAVRSAISSGSTLLNGNSSAKGNLLGEIGSITVANL